MNIDRASFIDGYMSHRELEWLARTASKSNGIIEIGSYKGRSTRAFLDNTEGKVYAIDPWNGPYPHSDGDVNIEFIGDDKLYDEFINNTRDCKNLVVFRGDSNQFCETLRIPLVDFVFIDGRHEYEYVKADILNMISLVRPGGILSGHDYGNQSWPGVQRAVDELFAGMIELERMIWWVRL